MHMADYKRKTLSSALAIDAIVKTNHVSLKTYILFSVVPAGCWETTTFPLLSFLIYKVRIAITNLFLTIGFLVCKK